MILTVRKGLEKTTSRDATAWTRNGNVESARLTGPSLSADLSFLEGIREGEAEAKRGTGSKRSAVPVPLFAGNGERPLRRPGSGASPRSLGLPLLGHDFSACEQVYPRSFQARDSGLGRSGRRSVPQSSGTHSIREVDRCMTLRMCGQIVEFRQDSTDALPAGSR